MHDDIPEPQAIALLTTLDRLLTQVIGAHPDPETRVRTIAALRTLADAHEDRLLQARPGWPLRPPTI